MYFLMFNQGLCSFENGFCGLKQDNSMENRWDLNFGHTPSTNTGPRYDHTTYSQKGIFFSRNNSFGLQRKLLLPNSSINFWSCWTGAYIYTEASRRSQGDRARLMSEWIEPSTVICLQFWYHMFGKHIGQLNVFQATNSSEMLVWSLSGNQGDKWMFTQATLQAEDRFKVCLLKSVSSHILDINRST